jgi:hypothetical protein
MKNYYTPVNTVTVLPYSTSIRTSKLITRNVAPDCEKIPTFKNKHQRFSLLDAWYPAHKIAVFIASIAMDNWWDGCDWTSSCTYDALNLFVSLLVITMHNVITNALLTRRNFGNFRREMFDPSH